MKFRNLGLAIAFMGLVGGSCIGAPPDVPVELKVKPGQMVRIPVKTDAEIGTLKNFGDTDAFWGELVGPKGQRNFVFQAPMLEADGTYKGKLQYVVGWFVKGETEGVATTITILYTPTPTPGPGPAPGPAPVTGLDCKNGCYVVVIADETNPTAAQNRVAEGPLLTSLKNGGKCRVYGSVSDSDKIKNSNYDKMMSDAKITAPALFVLDKGGKALLAIKLPSDEAGVTAALKGVSP